MLIGVGWSVIYKIGNEPKKYYSTALNPKCNYNHPNEWADRNFLEEISESTLTIIDYRRITQEEYDLFHEMEVKPKVLAGLAAIFGEENKTSYGI